MQHQVFFLIKSPACLICLSTLLPPELLKAKVACNEQAESMALLVRLEEPDYNMDAL